MWLFRCNGSGPDCRGEVVTRFKDVRRGKTTSCGCEKSRIAKETHRGDPNKVAATSVIKKLRRDATKRGYLCELTDEQILDICCQPCLYCGIRPIRDVHTCTRRSSTEWKALTSRKFGGVDRVFNDFGYQSNNVVPCCQFCNRAKGDHALFKWLFWIQESALSTRLQVIKSELVSICGPDWEQRMMDEWKQHQEKEQAS